jgi:hypothetical protein
MTKEPKMGDRMFELMKADKKLMEEKYNLMVAGWCADEGPDTKKGKWLMAKEFSWMIILVGPPDQSFRGRSVGSQTQID